MEWYRQRSTKTSNKNQEGIKFTYGTVDKRGSKTIYIYFLGDAYKPFEQTERMCISNPLEKRIYFGDAEIEGVPGWKLYKKGGNPHLQFDVGGGDGEIEKAWPKDSIYKLQYDTENGMYFIEREISEKARKWKRVKGDIVCPSCGFSVSGIRRGEELKYCPNCGSENNKEG